MIRLSYVLILFQIYLEPSEDKIGRQEMEFLMKVRSRTTMTSVLNGFCKMKGSRPPPPTIMKVFDFV